MHWLDIIILVVLGVGAAMGFSSGLLWQVARIVSLAASLYAAVLMNASAADWVGSQWNDVSPAVNRVVAFIAVFVLVYLVLYLITGLVHQAIKATKMETLDRVLGALLGAAKMAAVMAGICAVMAALELQIFKEWFEQATLAAHFAKGSEAAVAWIPQAYRDRTDEGIQQVREQVQQKIVVAAKDTLRDVAARK